MLSSLSNPQVHVYFSIGLNLKTNDVADTSLRWGGEERFHQALTRELTAEKCWEKWGHLTRNKKTAPYAVWSIFAAGSEGRFKDDVLARTAVAFDIDTGNVSAQSLELALTALGWESAFYTTWKARKGAMRWRVVIPLATPHTVAGWNEFYKQKLTEFQTALEVHHGSSVPLDLSAQLPAQAQILPHEIPSMFLVGMTTKKLSACLSSMEKHEDSLPGFEVAKVFGTRGVALTHGSTFVLSDGARRTLSPARFAVKTEGRAERKSAHKAPAALTETVVYAGNAESEVAKSVAEGWATRGFMKTPELAHGIDGALYLAENGIHTEQGLRRSTIVGALWNLHRAGWLANDIMKLADRIIAKSKKVDQAYLTKEAGKFLEKDLIPFEKSAAKMEAAILKALSRGEVSGKHVSTDTRRLFARILSRAKHCYEPGGGALSQEQIAECTGLGKSWNALGMKVVRAFFGDCERAGLLIASGEKMRRTYRLISLDDKKVDAPA